MTTMTGERYEIVPLIVPEHLGDDREPAVRPFHEAVDFLNQPLLDLRQHADHCQSTNERLVSHRGWSEMERVASE